MAKGRYEESSIRVLKGLEPVRERPGMYTRTTDPTHIIAEVIDNAADEALGGYATRIDVRMHADQSVSVEDNGRGIPVGPHPEEKIPTVELVEGDPARPNRALQDRRVGDVEVVAAFLEQASRRLRLGEAFLAQIDVRPAGKAVFLIPCALAMTEKDERLHAESGYHEFG